MVRWLLYRLDAEEITYEADIVHVPVTGGYFGWGPPVWDKLAPLSVARVAPLDFLPTRNRCNGDPTHFTTYGDVRNHPNGRAYRCEND